ncbi:hypothetical protein D3C76_750780 [compost metagenome]
MKFAKGSSTIRLPHAGCILQTADKAGRVAITIANPEAGSLGRNASVSQFSCSRQSSSPLSMHKRTRLSGEACSKGCKGESGTRPPNSQATAPAKASINEEGVCAHDRLSIHNVSAPLFWAISCISCINDVLPIPPKPVMENKVNGAFASFSQRSKADRSRSRPINGLTVNSFASILRLEPPVYPDISCDTNYRRCQISVQGIRPYPGEGEVRTRKARDGEIQLPRLALF